MNEPIDPSNLPDTNHILRQVAKIRLRLKNKEIQQLMKQDKLTCRLKLEKEFQSFFEKYPSLFKHLFDDGDLVMLGQMLCAIDDIKNGTKSIKNVEKELGEELASKYIYPKV
jgi:hypothetical protein